MVEQALIDTPANLGSEGDIQVAVGPAAWQEQSTDCETLPPSSSSSEDSELGLVMEELNKLNEADARSVTSKTSKISASSSSSNTGRSGSPSRTVARTASCHNSMDQTESVGGNVVGDSGVGDVASSGRQEEDCQPEDEDDNEVDLWTVWGNLIKSWESEMKRKPNCVKELVRRGVPQHFRTIAWQLLSNAKSQQIHDLYTEYLRQSSPYEKVILRDIPRTYPELEFFKDGCRGQQSLFNVIKCYSIHDREVGYCQGSAFIVGQLLLQMPEEEAFSVFVRLMEHYRLRELYKPTMTQLGLCMFQLEVIVQEQMPDLYMHFNNMGFDTSMYASSWFLTLFTTTLSIDLANRIMDLFLVDGMDAIFRLALAILQQSRIELLKLDMEGMLKYFQRDIKELYENDHELLFAVAARVILNAKRMKRLEKDYLAKRSKEQEEAIELRGVSSGSRLAGVLSSLPNPVSLCPSKRSSSYCGGDCSFVFLQFFHYLYFALWSIKNNLLELFDFRLDLRMIGRRRSMCRRFRWTQKRLRTENRLLRQRIEYLEQESSALADRLIRGQVDLAQQADNCLSVSHELNVLRDINSEAHRRLEDAYETIRELSGGGPDKNLVETGAQVDDTSMIEHIHSLQQELIETHSKKSDLENIVREMKLRIHELESANKRLKESSPDGGIAAIQEELIRVKMREAEASLSLKEMRQRLSEMEQQWTKYMECRAQAVLHSQSMHKLSSTESSGSPTGSPIAPSSSLTINEQADECSSSVASQASPSSSTTSAPSPPATNGCPSTALREPGTE
uniref:Rab-GAP TBC domain-containing protein n=1 Tax=Ditylenchus dipsaci TaxID=166011 RepID=A0A915DNN6_9BILA